MVFGICAVTKTTLGGFQSKRTKHAKMIVIITLGLIIPLQKQGKEISPRTVFKLQSMFCGQMCVEIINSAEVTISPMFTLTLLYIGQAFRKMSVLPVKYPCKLMKISKKCPKIWKICCFLEINFLLYLYLTANICPIYLMQP